MNYFPIPFVLCIALVVKGSITSVPSVSPSRTLPPSIYDPTVGTAFAPTTPGGQCLNANDYSIWTETNSNGETGYTLFFDDIATCAAACVNFYVATQSTLYDCGGFGYPNTCPSDLYTICASDCLGHRAPMNFVTLEQTRIYSPNCTWCMGELTYCGAVNCADVCIVGEQRTGPCRECNELYCSLSFESCSGLNPDVVENGGLDWTPIAIGSAVGFVVLLVLALICGYIRYENNKFKKVMNPNEMAILARTQSIMTHASMVKNPRFDPKSISRFPPRSAKMSQLAVSVRSTRRYTLAANLICRYTFRGENPDELSVYAGTKLYGLECQDEWWLAMTEQGIFGLIPKNYTEIDSPPQSTKSTENSHFEPEF